METRFRSAYLRSIPGVTFPEKEGVDALRELIGNIDGARSEALNMIIGPANAQASVDDLRLRILRAKEMSAVETAVYAALKYAPAFNTGEARDKVLAVLDQLKLGRLSEALAGWIDLDQTIGFVANGAYALDLALIEGFGQLHAPELYRGRDPDWGKDEGNTIWYLVTDKGIAKTALGPPLDALPYFQEEERICVAAAQAGDAAMWYGVAVNACLNQAEALIYAGDLDGASRAIEKAREHGAEMLKASDDREAAEARLRDIEPYAGHVAALRGDAAAAAEAFAKAGELSDQPAYWKARFLASIGKTDEARAIAESLLEGASPVLEAQCRLLLGDAKLLEDAKASLEKNATATYVELELQGAIARELGSFRHLAAAASRAGQHGFKLIESQLSLEVAKLLDESSATGARFARAAIEAAPGSIYAQEAEKLLAKHA